MINKFFHAPFHQMADISFQLVLIELSSYGTLKVNANIPSRIIFIKTGFQKLDIFQSQAKAVLQVNSLPQLDGMDILKSGTIKLSTLKIHSRPMMLTSTPLLFHLEETLLLLEEKTWKLEFSISVMFKKLFQFMILNPPLPLWLLTQNAIGLLLELNSDGKSGTLNQKIHQLLLMDNSN